MLTQPQGCIIISVTSHVSFLVYVGHKMNWNLPVFPRAPCPDGRRKVPHPAIWSPTFSGSDGHELTHSFVSLPQCSRDRCLEPSRHQGRAGAGQTERSMSSSLPCGTWSPPRLGKWSTSTLSYNPRGPQLRDRASESALHSCSWGLPRSLLGAWS